MIVVDAALIVDLITWAPGAERIASRLTGEDLHAPHLLDTEVVSAIRGLLLGGHVTEARAMDALADYNALAITRWPTHGDLRQQMLRLRDNVSAYDAAYLALAGVLGCPVVTRDYRLGRLTLADSDVEVL
jgi:predicted nucleic acid-binding protein